MHIVDYAISKIADLTRTAVLFCLTLGELFTTAWPDTPQAATILLSHLYPSNQPVAIIEYAQAAIKYVVTSHVNRKI